MKTYILIISILFFSNINIFGQCSVNCSVYTTPETCAGCCDGTAQLGCTGMLGTFHWSNGDATQSIAGLCAGSYTVTVTDMQGCPTLFYCNVTTQGGSTDIVKNSNANSNLSIYPNPNNGNFIIETNLIEKQTLQIFDVTGKMVLSQTINGKTNIDMSSLDNGIYFIQLKTKENISTQKIIVQH
jgi:hypothetical protein